MSFQKPETKGVSMAMFGNSEGLFSKICRSSRMIKPLVEARITLVDWPLKKGKEEGNWIASETASSAPGAR